ncbi:MAG: hypothetical protein ACJAT2_000367 [Bacteriovoracaceae bacterium]|jgi:hypothetical protein
MKFLILGLLAFSLNSFAADGPVAKVIKIKGKVTFDGKLLKLGDSITKKGVLKSEKRSFAQVSVEKWNNKITIGPKSEMEFDFNKDAKKKYVFLNGRCRWRTDTGKKGKGRLYTKVASMGVRGTDYLVVSNKGLGETEIVVLDGAVEFENLSDPSEKALVKKGQWGGLGGRFGDKIGKILDLPKDVVDSFDRQLKFH